MESRYSVRNWKRMERSGIIRYLELYTGGHSVHTGGAAVVLMVGASESGTAAAMGIVSK